MTEPSLAIQKALRSRFVGASAVTALVAASAIMDRNARPEVFPCILLGEAQTVTGSDLARRRVAVFLDLHVFATETGLTTAKQIAGAIRDALKADWYAIDGWRVADLKIASTRFLRDPDGVHSHSVVTVEAELVETV